jgi:quinol monooxygenase YgiN
MRPIRVIHQFENPSSPNEEFAAYARSVRGVDGATEAEAYADIDGDATIAYVELWCDEKAYADHWSKAPGDSVLDDLLRQRVARLGAKPAEFYPYQLFQLDRAWIADDRKEWRPAIVWAADGGVRVALQLGLRPSDELRHRLVIDQQKTRLEPGCLEYRWFQGVDVPEHFLLLELWESQFIYDNHWNLRLKVGSNEPPLPMTERERGAMGIEFYRQRQFIHLYDRWLPSEPTRWSETIVWPS